MVVNHHVSAENLSCPLQEQEEPLTTEPSFLFSVAGICVCVYIQNMCVGVPVYICTCIGGKILIPSASLHHLTILFVETKSLT